MTTLVEVRKSDGRLIGRCDERCYNAQGEKCTCCCRGMHHGKGLSQAVRSRDFSLDIEKRYGIGATVIRSPIEINLHD